MRKLCTAFCLLVSYVGYAQDAHTFSKAFRLKDAAVEMAGSEKGKVESGKEKKFARTSPRPLDSEKLNEQTVHYLSTTEAIEIEDEANQVRTGNVTITDTDITLRNGCKFTIRYFVVAQRDVPGSTTPVPVAEIKAEKGFIKFDEDKIWVNPNLTADYENEGIFYYKLSNRQTLRFRFGEWSASAFTLPLKFRFGGAKSFTGNTGTDSTKTFSEDFTTAINLNLFVGHTLFGRASYHYREKVGNITTTEKIMFGALIGASTVTLDKNNTSAARKPLTGDTKITKGLLTMGVGLTYSINKLNAGLFGGIDWSIGSSASLWNYNHRPWVGLAVGYSLFPFSQ